MLATQYGIDLSMEKFDVNYIDGKGKAKKKEVKNQAKDISKFFEPVSKDAVLCAEDTGIYEWNCYICIDTTSNITLTLIINILSLESEDNNIYTKMKTNDIISMSAKPVIYEKGTAFMWTDNHISKQLLNTHLNPDIDLASRKQTSIEKTIDWILSTQQGKEKLNILDLGCGPGLYAEFLAKQGHSVTGIDISETSIDYAQQSAEKKGLEISYINNSYLDIEFPSEQYDLILLIYTDFGALIPTEQELLLKKIYKTLKKGGTFIFDVLKDNYMESKIAPNTWEASNNGFWKPTPYFMLSQSFLYKEEKVVLFQNILIDKNEKIEIYRFWTHFFNENDIEHKLTKSGFANINFNDNVLPEEGQWNGDNVLFTIAAK